MSFDAMRWAISQRVGSAAAHHVLLVLADAAGAKDNSCTMSHALIAVRTQLSPRCVLDAMATLQGDGAIRRERRFRDRGQRTSDRIILLVNRPASPEKTAKPKDQAAPQALRKAGAQTASIAVRNHASQTAENACRRSGPNREIRGSKPQNTLALTADSAEEPSLEPSSEPEERESGREADYLFGPQIDSSDDEATSGEQGSASFKEWWRLYPKARRRDAAEAAYLEIVDSGRATAAELLSGLRAYLPEADQLIADGRRRFIPNPARWLADGAWRDQPEPQEQPPRQRAVNGGGTYLDQAMDGLEWPER